MKKYKKIMALLLCLCMILSTAGCGGKSNSDSNGGSEASKDTTFSWWLFSGADSSYYPNYNDNPAIQYLNTKTWGSDNKKIALDFIVPVAGQEKDNSVTLISTGEYPDIMDLSAYPGTITELYNDGIALDITEYVEKYMPNYLSFLEAHPDLKATSMNMVDGKKMYLGLYNYEDAPGYMWGGFMYRRDWIVKYGKNPNDGSTFSGSYTLTKEDGTPDKDSWQDNVVFPSGGAEPIYISDWEWMMEIFQTAIEDQKISDGYGMSLYYPGYQETGDLLCAFGGGGGGWYKDPNGKIIYGPTTDNFRTYLQCMNTWYKNDWIDKAFPEHATDNFYQIDDQKVRSGKVGLWYGLESQLGGKMDTGEGLTEGIVVCAAPQPINDIYGTEAQQNVVPYTMYQASMEGMISMITNKAKDKDLPTLFAMLDYLYSEEGSLVKSFGLNKEQYEETKNEMYTQYGLTNGAYHATEDGNFVRDEIVVNDGGTLKSAVTGERIIGLRRKKQELGGNPEIIQNNIALWTKYTCTGRFNGSVDSQLSVEDNKIVSKSITSTREFLTKNTPSFIQGKKDPFNDEDWNSYVKAMSKYAPDKVTQIYQTLYDSLK